MRSKSWYRSVAVLLLTSVLLPPLGLVLLWIRPKTGLVSKLAGSLAIAALGVVHLHVFFGLRMEVDGTGVRPIFSFYKPESHYAALERSRSGQRNIPEQRDISAVSPTTADQTNQQLESRRRGSKLGVEPATTFSGTGTAAYWTDFRGPNRDGRYDEREILTDWPSHGLPLLWRQPVGGGYASFVVAQGRAFTIEQRRRQEVVAAYDMETGHELWTHSWNAEFRESMGGDGPRATPAWDEGRLYALGATGELHCLEASTGKLMWARNILMDNGANNLEWGMAASPLIVDEKVIVLAGGRSGKSVVAYNKLTGHPIWKSLNDKQAYTSPMLVTLAGRRQILVVSAPRAMGVTVEDGSLLWDYAWRTAYDVNAAQPIVLGENRFFISAGYDHGAAVVEVTKTDRGFAARTIWKNNRMKNKFNSSVLHESHVYGLDEGIMACIDVRTGERKWKGGRYGYGQVLLASGHLIVLTELGDVVLVKATPERHQELARFSALKEKTWNHPVIADGRLLVRNTTEMACFDIRE
ncbi:PQQ-like beta-propeller repeat protein [Acidobacteria bacterium AH-259-A15]|nr:PQQ-like beta-propeller repeat protein [Acidobacteria bacterium AH-259-A15]